ncbi:hypothetical protein [Jeotgalibaca porci]|uniref:hypothetical protein n=1 Tax=Jeotgalibaca porci TaxID=1868793 RepID=UPI00359F2494
MAILHLNSHDYISKIRMPSGQTAEIIFEAYTSENNEHTYFWVVLDVYHKRKQRDENVLKQTGKDGIQTLLWAKKQIIEFEELLLEGHISWLKENVYIALGWEDNRRRRVYERGLRDIGFRYEYSSDVWDGKKVLLKKIK